MPRLPLAALAAAASLALAACDFTPSLDIDTPEYEPRAVINAVLQTDSVAVVRVGVTDDPYRQTPDPYAYRQQPTRTDATVTLLRDGQPVETLAVRSRQCLGDTYDPETGEQGTYQCGPFAGAVPLEAGVAYTVRVEVPGLPAAEGTVTMPAVPHVTVEEIEPDGNERRFRVRVEDPGGLGDRYGVSLLELSPDYVCYDREDGRECETIRVNRHNRRFETSDPVILASASEVPGEDVWFASVTDETFDGQTWSFTMSADEFFYHGDEYTQDRGLVVQIATLSGDVYDAYRIATFGGASGDENPFAEPVNLPSNVTGGYGLVGAVGAAEVAFEVEAPPAP
jgi:hypothetical protein